MDKSFLLSTPLQEVPHQHSVVEKASRRNESGAPKYTWRGKLLLALAVAIGVGAGWLLARNTSSNHDKIALPPEEKAAERDSAAVTVTVEPVTIRKVHAHGRRGRHAVWI